MKISIIAALSTNDVIGYQNQLPWHLPADLQHFKAITWGKPIVMGRKTFESIGKPLPGRQNIVISKQQNVVIDGCDVVDSIEAALSSTNTCEEVMIIGGATIYQQIFPMANYLYLTRIHQEVTGDAYFPSWDPQQWQQVRHEAHQDEKTALQYSFIEYQRITASETP